MLELGLEFDLHFAVWVSVLQRVRVRVRVRVRARARVRVMVRVRVRVRVRRMPGGSPCKTITALNEVEFPHVPGCQLFEHLG